MKTQNAHFENRPYSGRLQDIEGDYAPEAFRAFCNGKLRFCNGIAESGAIVK